METVVAGYNVQKTLYLYGCGQKSLNGKKLGERDHRLVSIVFSAGPQDIECCRVLQLLSFTYPRCSSGHD